MEKPFSQACENNKAPILQIIKNEFKDDCVVWEIGAGTGQHACHFAAHLPQLTWQPTDRQENLAGILLWQQDADLPNLCSPLALNVSDADWPCESIPALFTANTLHIMHWNEVECLFRQLNKYLVADAIMCIYGPFNYDGNYTSESNQRFDQWLKDRDPESGIRDVEAIAGLAEGIGLQLVDDHAMPANNRLLVWQRT